MRSLFHQYELDEMRAGVIVYDERRGLEPDEIQDVERKHETAGKKLRRFRRQRRLEESLSWSLK